MTQISVRLTGADNVQIGIRKFGAALPDVTIVEMESTLELARHEVSGWYAGGNSYAVPTRSGQKYIRTGDYGSKVQLVQQGATFRVESGSDHSVWVGGRADGGGQIAEFLQRGWPNFKATVEKFAGTLTGKIDRSLQKSAEAAGL